MSYEKQNWKNGDVITESKLNHMEDGIAGGGVLVVNATMEGATITFDKTWQQIYDAPYAVGVIVTEQGDDILKMYVNITQTSVEQGVYKVYAVLDGSDSIFIANSADGYPSVTMG